MNKHFDSYRWHQPSVVIQSAEEITRGYTKGTYVIMWTNVSTRFGIFRVESLKDNLGMNKRHTMNILKAAYKGLTLKSFTEALEFCRVVGIKIGFYDKNNEFSYLAW